MFTVRPPTDSFLDSDHTRTPASQSLPVLRHLLSPPLHSVFLTLAGQGLHSAGFTARTAKSQTAGVARYRGPVSRPDACCDLGSVLTVLIKQQTSADDEAVLPQQRRLIIVTVPVGRRARGGT